MSLLNSIATRARSLIASLAHDDRGVTTEHVIWIAGLAALALTIVGIFGPEITAAAKSVVFK
ncbi:hypothetical protein [Streptomyces cupreus]|uniref:Uncharacterized protein n=1 Tax=Streptomyces cupreus TaxID=2759956 RepID=A0A7X1J0D3_9ACTN|nr:hypothetical protein [Streptomyces cupreus]MBC2901893.1 hypothetical protein [Streptomyces cupreus]